MELNFLDRHKDYDEIEKVWNQLGSMSNHSYFLSWGWMENWITSLPNEAKVRLAVISEKADPVLAFFMGESAIVRGSIFRSRGLFLNTTGIPVLDALCIEYNAMNCPMSPRCSLGEILEKLGDEWDEFFMPGLDREAFPGKSLNDVTFPYKIVVEREESSPYVDLGFVRQKGGEYLSLLSSNTRAQIRRSYRDFERRGGIAIQVGKDLEHSLEIYEELVKLHQETWQKRSSSGAFASNVFYKFHKALIEKRFKPGEIQLLRIRSGDSTVGCLYNFVYKGWVYFYQSGMNYDIDEDLRPGIICHVEAIKYNAQLGNSAYDFLGGLERYKSSLATHGRQLIWAKVQRPRARFCIEDRLKNIKHSLTQRG